MANKDLDVRLAVRISSSEHAKYAKAADYDERTFSSFIRHILKIGYQEWEKKNGYKE